MHDDGVAFVRVVPSAFVRCKYHYMNYGREAFHWFYGSLWDCAAKYLRLAELQRN